LSDITFLGDVSVQLISHSVSDNMPVQAARVSTVGEASLEAPAEGEMRGLLNYLMKNRHGSPFEHGSMTFFIEVPIFVAREWMRHRAGWSYNETSGRYRELEPRFYLPGEDRKLVQVGKTGAYEFEPGLEVQRRITNEDFRSAYNTVWWTYLDMLDNGIAKEVARMVLPVGLMTTFYATCNPRSLMHFLGLRTLNEDATFPSKPQAEIAMAADKLEAIFAQLMPVTHDVWNKNGRVAP
jgi:thymidylate synthase (FAD)